MSDFVWDTSPSTGGFDVGASGNHALTGAERRAGVVRPAVTLMPKGAREQDAPDGSVIAHDITSPDKTLSSPGVASLHPSASEDIAAPAFSLHQRDAVDWLSSLRDESVDLVITDPPYESLEKHRAIGTTTRLTHSKASSNDWFQIFPNTRFPELFKELFRVLRKNRHFYLFCDAETMFVAKPAAEQQGFRFWKPLVWDKQRIGMGYHYRSRYEFILFFEKGKRKLNNLGQPDIIECPRIHKGYPTEKPAFVSEVLIQQSTEEGEMVIDPFFGSASVGEAALRQRRPFIGCDLSGHALEVARRRLLEWGPASDALYHSRLQAQQSLI